MSFSPTVSGIAPESPGYVPVDEEPQIPTRCSYSPTSFSDSEDYAGPIRGSWEPRSPNWSFFSEEEEKKREKEKVEKAGKEVEEKKAKMEEKKEGGEMDDDEEEELDENSIRHFVPCLNVRCETRDKKKRMVVTFLKNPKKVEEKEEAFDHNTCFLESNEKIFPKWELRLKPYDLPFIYKWMEEKSMADSNALICFVLKNPECTSTKTPQGKTLTEADKTMWGGIWDYKQKYNKEEFERSEIGLKWEPKMNLEDAVFGRYLQVHVSGKVLGWFCTMAVKHEGFLESPPPLSVLNLKKEEEEMWDAVTMYYDTYKKHVLGSEQNELYREVCRTTTKTPSSSSHKKKKSKIRV